MCSVVPYPTLLFCTAPEIMLFCFVLLLLLLLLFLMASCKDGVARSMLASSWVLMLGGILMLSSPIWCLLRACSVHHSTLNFWAIFKCTNSTLHFCMLLSVSSIYALMHSKWFKALCTEVCNSGLPDYHKFTDNYRADVSYNLSTIRNCANRSVWKYPNIS